MQQRGFTLLELLAVLTLLGVAMSLTATGVSHGLASIRERQPVNTLLLNLRQAHDLALIKQRAVRVTFNPQSLCYQLEETQEWCFPEGYSLTTKSAITNFGKHPVIVFNTDGSSSGGNVRISTPVRDIRIDVSWLTGRATLVSL